MAYIDSKNREYIYNVGDICTHCNMPMEHHTRSGEDASDAGAANYRVINTDSGNLLVDCKSQLSLSAPNYHFSQT